MKKKLVSLLLTAGLVAGLLAGCGGSSENVDTPAAGGETEAPAEAGGEEAPAEEEGGEATAPEDNGEESEIVVALMCFAPIDTAVQDRIEAAVNEKMSEMINVTADFTWYDASTYMQQVPMMIQSGEQLDVIMFTPIPAAGYSSFMAQGQLMDIKEYIDAYGSDIKAVLGEDGIAATTRNGGVYGAGGNLSRYGGGAIMMRTDVLEEINMKEKFDNMETWTEFEEILLAAKDAGYTGIVNSDAEGSCITAQPFITGSERLDEAYWVDVAGDGNQQIYIDPADDTVKCYYMNEDYKASLLRAGDWYEKGLIYRDASTADDYSSTQIKNGVGVAMVQAAESGWETTVLAASGYEMSGKFTGAMTKASTTSYTKFGFGVPVTAENPEGAVKFINLLYSNNEVHDMMCFGVEGVDWVKTDNGTAAYPDGATESEYHQQDFLYGDVMSLTPWGDDPDYNVKRQAENEGVEPSKYVGFAVDNTSVANQVTACQNITNEFKPMISAGVYGADTEAKYQEWMAGLEGAGINDIIAEYQRQLDEWLASK